MDILKLFFQYIKNVMSAIGAAWSALDIMENFLLQLEDVQLKKDIILFVAGCAAVLCLIHYIYLLLFFTCDLGIADTSIKIRYGNILKKKNGTVVIGINQELKTDKNEIGRNSIHYQIVDANLVPNIKELFKKEKNRLEKNENGNQIAPMGTSFSWNGDNKHYLFLVMSRLLRDQTPQATREDIQTAIKTLFNQQETLDIEKGNLYIPLVGTGEAGVRISRNESIKMIVSEYIASHAREDQKNPNHIKVLEIVIYWRDILKYGVLTDFIHTQNEIRKMIELCGQCNYSKQSS